MKKIRSLLFIVLFLEIAALYICSNYGVFSEIPTYRKASYEIPTSLDPIRTSATSENVLANLMYEGLVTIDDSLKVTPQLAESWTCLENGTHYIFKIRKNALFHDGSSLTSKDVVLSLLRLIHSREQISINNYKQISSIYSSDEYSVHIKLKSSYPSFLATLAAPTAKISKPELTNGYHLGSGPFKFSAIEKKNGKRVLKLEAFAFYPSKPAIKKMEIWELNEEEAIKLAEGGVIHDTAMYPINQIKETHGNSVKDIVAPAAVTWVFSMNAAKKPLSNINLRTCLNNHFRKQRFMDQFLPKLEVAKGYLPPTLPGSTINENEPTIDGKDCVSLFSGVTLALDYPDGMLNSKEMCEFFAEDMKNIEVNIRCNPIKSFNELLARITNKKSELSFLGMSLDLPDVEYFLNTFESSSKFNISNFSSKKIDSLLARSRVESDREKRSAIFSEINLELFKNVVTINISYPWHRSYHHKCLDGFNVGLAGDAFIDYQRVKLNPFCLRRKDFDNG